ncbi:Transporter, major facilitator family protein [Aphelenchoides besseyi]|nr:Transporter, major facilitator family protein [Aphelenchoides besseyi]
MSNTNDSNNDNHWLSSGSGSIADMVAEASRSFVTNEMLPGFTYNQEYDVYYNSTTGYYFDLKTSLYYHPNTRLYYSYDPETGTYKTFQHPNAQQSKWKKEANKHPPCIRLIEETNRNCLHIITIDGGFIGFGSKCDVSIGRAEGVAEKHAQILYNTDDASNPCYTIEPLNNGFPFHYNEHEIKGPSNTGERRRTHRQEMRAMKAKYGVFEPNENSTAKHRDRAAERREVFGSEPSIPKRRPQPQFPQVVAVQQPQPTTSTKIKSDNIGFKLLKNMGWQDGSGLGATNQGINAPFKMSELKGVLEHRFRYVILVLGWICLSSIASNMNIYNMTRLCMSDKNSTHGFQVDYTEKDHNQLIMAAAFGTIVAVFPYNSAYTRFGARYVFLFAGTMSSISTALIPLAVRLGWKWTYATRFIQLCSSSFGWESVFYLHSIVTATLMILWFLLYEDQPSESSFVSAGELEKINRHKGPIDFNVPVPYRAIISDPFVWCLLFNGFSDIFSGIFCVTYQPLYTRNVLNFDIRETAFLAIAGPLFHIPLKFLFGYSSDKIKFLSEKSKLIICNTIAVFCPGLSYLSLAFLPVDLPWLHVAQFSLIGITFASAGAGFYKAANLYSR